jgi:hypothetical protein
MNLTTTRAERTACAGPDIALRPFYNPTSEPEVRHPSPDAHVPGSSVSDAESGHRSVQTDDETFGMLLLGIGYDTSIA